MSTRTTHSPPETCPPDRTPPSNQEEEHQPHLQLSRSTSSTIVSTNLIYNCLDQPHLQLTRPTKRKNITSACESCQRSKAKCDGCHPCGRCKQKLNECTYITEQDKRRKNSDHRKDAELFHHLLEAVRDSSDDRVLHLIGLMRSRSPVEDVKLRINQELSSRQAARGLRILPDTVEHEWQERHMFRKDALQVRRLIDSPPYPVQCRPWTSVTDDDDLASHLISIWMTWDKPWYNWIDEHLFLRDMRRGVLHSNYCSPFLVNALLAWACPYSDYHEAHTRDGAISVLMQRFIDEARHLLEEDMKKPPNLPTVQGLALLFLALALAGQDRLGYQLMVQVIAMCEELERSPPLTHGSDEDAQDLSRTIALTCWGVYNMTTASFISFMRPQFMREPKSRPPAPRYSDTWSPYPCQADPVLSYNDELFFVHCDVQVIAASLTQLLFDDTSTLPISLREAKVIMLRGQLLKRLEAMPGHLHLKEGAPASVLTHHIWYQVIILRMYLALQTPDHTQNLVRQSRSICTETAIRVSEIIRLHMRSYGCELMNNMYAQAFSLSLYTLLDAPEDTNNHLAVTSLFIGLRGLSKRWPMIMGILRMVQRYAKKVRYTLPLDADRLLAGFEDDWNRRKMRRLLSVYPQPAVAANSLLGPGEVKDMTRFLEQMENLDLDNR